MATDTRSRAAVQTSDNTWAVTYSAPTNIACIKYWGKRDKAGLDLSLNLPLNSSVSVTLNQAELRTVTTVVASTTFPADRLWLNGSEEDVPKNKRVVKVLQEVRARATAVPAEAHVHIVSENNFPTAAGLASSAAGYACLVAALADLFGVPETYLGEVSTIARMGSGSACRSLYGGFVRWQHGERDDGTDSIAVQVAPRAHWPELSVLILVVSDQKKDTSSTSGMLTSVRTSELLRFRAAEVVPKRLADIEAAYTAQDFDTFGRITMQDSNQFHACCADTYPPIFYMNDVSRAIVRTVHKINDHAGRVKAAYTFDAGPNAVIYLLKDDVVDVLSVLLAQFPHSDPVASSDPAVEAAARAAYVPPELHDAGHVLPDVLTKIYHTTVGEGAGPLPADSALAHTVSGMPTST